MGFNSGFKGLNLILPEHDDDDDDDDKNTTVMTHLKIMTACL